MRQVWALVAACAVALLAPAQGPVAADDEYRQALEEHRRALEEHRRTDAEAERSIRWLTYGTLALLAVLLLWYLVAARQNAVARRRQDEQADRRNLELQARAEDQTARVIELLESIDRQLREGGKG